jgi:quinol monooxygenase YgiN
MKQVAVIAEWQTTAEGNWVFKQAALKLVEESKKEQGCIAYDLYESDSEPFKYTFVEVWKDDKALEQHTKRNHYITMVQIMQLAAKLTVRVLKKVSKDGKA